MLYLKRRNLRGVSIRELLRAQDAGNAKGLVGLTFDDGYEDFLYTALPILERYGFSATVFVVGGMLGGKNDWDHWYSPKPTMRLLGAADLREVSERGMEIGSHSTSHAKLPDLDIESLEREVSHGRQVLSEVLGEAVEGFCYPYGILNNTSIQAVRRAQYTYACAVNARVEWNIYDLPRIPVSQVDNPLRFAAKLRIHSHYRAVKRIYLHLFNKQEH
jgi:peptidoglycan/xylan/chitin deacetylase (PgdA/CDA1 family)